MEGNQGGLLQIKPNGATFLKKPKSTGATEQKTVFHTTASARMSGRMAWKLGPLVHLSNFNIFALQLACILILEPGLHCI